MRLIFLLLVFVLKANAQINWSAYPKELQFFARDEFDKAYPKLKASYKAGSFVGAKVQILKNGQFYFQKTLASKIVNDVVYIDDSVRIEAGLNRYTLLLYNFKTNTDSTLFRQINAILCGDVAVFYGQSNAQATENIDYFIEKIKGNNGDLPNLYNRTFFNNQFWGINQIYEVGGLAYTFGNDYQKNAQMPICILNGSIGNTGIQDLTKYENLLTDKPVTFYEKLYKDVGDAGFEAKVKFFIWRQGEADSYWDGRSLEYKSNFDKLYKQLKRDFIPRGVLYYFQNNLINDGSKYAGSLRETQRKLQEDYPNVFGISSVGLSGYEGLHYKGIGYEEAGLLIAKLVLKNQKISAYSNVISSPSVQKIVQSLDKSNIKIIFEPSQKLSLNATSSPFSVISFKKLFFNVNSQILLKSGSCQDNTILLSMEKPIKLDSISYFSPTIAFDIPEVFSEICPKNQFGFPVFTFEHFKVTQTITAPKLSIQEEASFPKLFFENRPLNIQNKVVIERKESDSFSLIKTTQATFFIDSTAKKDRTYQYRIRVEGDGFESENSNIVEKMVVLNIEKVIDKIDTSNPKVIDAPVLVLNTTSFLSSASTVSAFQNGSNLIVNLSGYIFDSAFDTNGRELTLQKLSEIKNQIIFNGYSLQTGIYILKLKKDGKFFTKKILFIQ